MPHPTSDTKQSDVMPSDAKKMSVAIFGFVMLIRYFNFAAFSKIAFVKIVGILCFFVSLFFN